MKKLIIIITIFVLFFSSCVTNSVKDFSYPLDGILYNAGVIAAKDFVTLGIIFVNTEEKIDSQGNHTGSKITYEMLMREADKLGADDIINIRIDVNQKEEIQKDSYSTEKTIITYTYTATGLAIKYTDAINSDSDNAAKNSDKKIDLLKTTDNVSTKNSGSKTGLIIGGIFLTGMIVGGVYALTSSM